MGPTHYTPTPEQIRDGCREIQDGWSEGDERQRRTGSSRVAAVEVMVIRIPPDAIQRDTLQ